MRPPVRLWSPRVPRALALDHMPPRWPCALALSLLPIASYVECPALDRRHLTSWAEGGEHIMFYPCSAGPLSKPRYTPSCSMWLPPGDALRPHELRKTASRAYCTPCAPAWPRAASSRGGSNTGPLSAMLQAAWNCQSNGYAPATGAAECEKWLVAAGDTLRRISACRHAVRSGPGRCRNLN